MNAPPNDRRGFVHKKLLRAATSFIAPTVASFVPGGSTILGLATKFTGSGGTAVARAPGCGTEAEFRQLVATRSWADVARICGTTVAAAQARLRPSSVAPTTIKPVSTAMSRSEKVATVRRMFATSSWKDIAKAIGESKEVAKAMYAPFRAASSAPTPTQVVQRAKPLDVVRMPRHPRSKIPVVQQVSMAMPRHKTIIPGLIDRFTGGGGGDPCPPGTIKAGSTCVDLTAALPFGDPLFQSAGGTPIMGRYGSAYVPGGRPITRKVCLPGDLVGDDGFCYSRGSITNKERMWPKGRQPLLTGGEMRAISIAARAAGKFERTQKRLQKLGMLKKPAARPRAPKLPPHQHQITSGG